MMNRRSFIKRITGTIAGLSILPKKGESLTPSEPTKKFDPEKEYGNVIFFCCKGSLKDNPEIVNKHKKTLDEDMKIVVPKEYRHRVHYRVAKHDYRRIYSVTWKYTPRFTVEKLRKVKRLLDETEEKYRDMKVRSDKWLILR